MKKIYLATLLAGLGIYSAQAQDAPFPPLDVNMYDSQAYPSDPTEVIIPESPIRYQVLLTGGVDMVYDAHSDQSSASKEWQDFTAFVPIDGRSDSGYVIVNHERMNNDAILGDGGGMTIFTVHQDAETGNWSVVEDENGHKYRNVDFSEVGGTAANCGGIQSPWGQVFTAEEWGIFFSNAAINKPHEFGMDYTYDGAVGGFSDTSDVKLTSFNGESADITLKKHENFQWMVEIDPATAKAVRKNYNMGRFDHEGGWIANDEKTVYLTDDNSSGSVFFKFVAEQARDFSKGQLYAYKQSADGESGEWMALDMDMETMMNAQTEALAKGATIFMRLEWVDGNDDFVYITETGRGKQFDASGAIAKGGSLVNHLAVLDDDNDGKADDIFGRILRFDPMTDKMEVLIEGGGELSGDVPTGNHLSSPDGLTIGTIGGRTYLAINEDMNPSGLPANPSQFTNVMNEAYFLDITGDVAGKEYAVSDLIRLMVGPSGCELTGGRFTPDGNTYFVNIQHPATTNTEPFNHSVTLAVTGFEEYLEKITSVEDMDDSEGFNVYPNPASRVVYINKVTDVSIYGADGQRLLVQRNTNQVDISSLDKGTYFLQTIEGDVKKLIIK